MSTPAGPAGSGRSAQPSPRDCKAESHQSQEAQRATARHLAAATTAPQLRVQVAGIAQAIAVGILLERIGCRRTIVASITHGVPVPIRLAAIDDPGTVIRQVQDPVVIIIHFEPVRLAVLVGIPDVRGYLRLVVQRVVLPRLGFST